MKGNLRKLKGYFREQKGSGFFLQPIFLPLPTTSQLLMPHDARFPCDQIRGEKGTQTYIFLASDRPVGGQSLGQGARGQRFMCYLRNPKNIDLFAWVPDREDR